MKPQLRMTFALVLLCLPAPLIATTIYVDDDNTTPPVGRLRGQPVPVHPGRH